MILDTIEGQDVNWEPATQILTYRAAARVDDDGVGPAHGDPCHQSQTSLKYQGQYLNADIDNYVVLPAQIVDQITAVCLGSQVYVTFQGKQYSAVLGDKGPARRIGEMSDSMESKIGANPNPNYGGVDAQVIDYEFHMGVPAVVDTLLPDGTTETRTYELQPS